MYFANRETVVLARWGTEVLWEQDGFTFRTRNESSKKFSVDQIGETISRTKPEIPMIHRIEWMIWNGLWEKIKRFIDTNVTYSLEFFFFKKKRYKNSHSQLSKEYEDMPKGHDLNCLSKNMRI